MGLSKREGSQSVASDRADGYEPMAVASLAVLIGTSEAVEPAADLAELATRFAPAKVSRAPARFDDAELDAVNARLLQSLSFSAVAGRLAELGVGGGEAFWNAVRKNCTRLADARRWWDIVSGPPPAVSVPDAEDAAFVAMAAERLPAEPWDSTTWNAWIGAVKSASGRSGKRLFMPLRLARTGLDHGPERAALLPVVGHTVDRETDPRAQAGEKAVTLGQLVEGRGGLTTEEAESDGIGFDKGEIAEFAEE